jgi:glycosyltransferase involved in cell wall biosynthesis
MQQNAPLISVVMTSYNHERFISEAIESVLNQTFPNFELIIVDDSSTDRSKEIIKQCQQKDSRVKTIFHPSNKGISTTINDGFSAARGRFVAYTNSDDLWTPEKLEKQICILQQNPDLIVWSDASIIDANGNETGQLFTQMQKAIQRQKSGFILRELIRSNFICGQSTIFETKITRQIKFDQRLTYLNDYKFMIDVAKKHHFYFIPKPLVKYRIHGDNCILKNSDTWHKDSFIIAKYVLKKYGSDIPDFLKGKLYYKIGRYIFNRKRYHLGRKFLFEAMLKNPLKTTYYKSYILSLFKENL